MKILPHRTFCGEFAIPGDKSITHRAIMFNAAARGRAEITGALLGEDCLSTAECMRALGARVEVRGGAVCVEGTEKFRDARLYCGNSGTTMRLLGADITTENGKPPVTLRAAPLHGADVKISVASAQVKSAILLAGLGARGETSVEEPFRSRDHTERMLAAMGADVRVSGNTVRIAPCVLHAEDVTVPADISSAAYFMALGALLGETVCKNVGVNPTRTGILRAFSRMNVQYALENERTVCGEPVADIRVKKSALRALTLTREDIPSLVDELPLIAVLCAFAEGESVIRGAEELRVKESDRIETTVNMLNALGGDCKTLPDGFVINGKKSLRGGIVDACVDHRIAMSGAVALTASEEGGEIIGAECVNISFPQFYSMLSKAN